MVSGLFGSLRHEIEFPVQSPDSREPAILIIAGPNGCGKTTILNMVGGMLDLDFNIFRRVPFSKAVLELDHGPSLVVERRDDTEFPLEVRFANCTATLSHSKEGYSAEQSKAIEAFRAEASPWFSKIKFKLLDIHRSLALRESQTKLERRIDLGTASEEDIARYYSAHTGKLWPSEPDDRETNILSRQVRMFVREAQVDYRKFFAAEELDLLPRLLAHLRTIKEHATTRDDLLGRLKDLEARSSELREYGVSTDERDMLSLRQAFATIQDFDSFALTVIEAYVDTLENRNKVRDLIADRLREFEAIMVDFLTNKSVRISRKSGLEIKTKEGRELREFELSSGEYHFLSMMVTALVSYRTGTIIAIDEPELSLHVTWQRKIISALAKCASRASPLFLFATHSPAVSSEHRDKIVHLKMDDLS